VCVRLFATFFHSKNTHNQDSFTFQKIENCFAYLNKSLIYNFI